MSSHSIRFVSLFALAAMTAAAGACVSASQYTETATERDSLAVVAEMRAEEIARLQTSYDSLTKLFEEEIAARELEVQRLVDGVQVEIPSDVMFASGASAAQVGEEGREFAVKLAEYLKDTDFFISVVGHTDSQQPRGALSQRYPTNWELAAARAANAVRFLTSQGVDPTQIIAVSRGEFDPIASNDTEEGRAKNRRVQVILRTLPE